LECTINLLEGGTIKVWPDLISESVAESISNEAINSNLFRQYPIQGGWEPRVHYLLHDETTSDFSDGIAQPGYKYSGIAMKAQPLGHVEALQQIVPQLAELCDVDSFNIGADIVLYRAGQDRIAKHSNSAQGEDRIMSLVVHSLPETRQIMLSQRSQSQEQYMWFFLWEPEELTAWTAYYKNITVTLCRLLKKQIPRDIKKWWWFCDTDRKCLSAKSMASK
jgi:hypothetical protein